MANKAVVEEKSTWKGGSRPMEASYGKLMMWYFLVSDAFTFGALLIVYATLRVSAGWSDGWSQANDVFKAFPGFELLNGTPLAFVTLMTFILIMSSVFVVRAVQEGHRMNQRGVAIWMFWGIIGGAAFLACQGFEWYGLIVHEGLSMGYNPFDPETGLKNAVFENGHIVKEAVSPGPKAFGNLFFLITGFHGTHVASGVVINIIIFIQTLRGVYQERGHYEMVEKVGLYWHFVDLVWVFVFLVFYLL